MAASRGAVALTLLLVGCEQLGGFDDFEAASGLGASGQAGAAGHGCAPPAARGGAMAERASPEIGRCRYIDVAEVTIAQYSEFTAEVTAESDKQRPDRCRDNGSYLPSAACQPAAPTDPSLPVTCVDWCDAEAYCRWAGKRLCKGSYFAPNDLSGSEWYAACSNDGQTVYPYGKTFTRGRCNGFEDGSKMASVQAFAECQSQQQPTVHDLTGNAAEWLDACDKNEGADDSCHAQGGSYRDDQAASDCGYTVTRERSGAEPFIGFRCCAGP